MRAKRTIAKRTIAVGLIAAVLAACVLIWLWRTPEITEEQVERIQVGMTLTEVNAILGCRPGNYTSVDHESPVWIWEGSKVRHKYPFKKWATDKPEPQYIDAIGPNRQVATLVYVWFDGTDRVVDKCSVDMPYTYRPSFWDRIRRFVSGPNAPTRTTGSVTTTSRNQKEGVGRTSLVVNLSAAMPVAVSRHASASRWRRWREPTPFFGPTLPGGIQIALSM